MIKLKRQKVHIKKGKAASLQGFRLHLKGIARSLILILLLGLMGIGLARLKYMFVDSDYFMIEGADIKLYDETGISLRNLSLKEIGGEKFANTNIFFMDLKDLKERIETAHPEFKDVVVRRLLPNRLIVQANLRKALAQICSDRYYPVDKEGVLLPDVKNFPESTLPIITGLGKRLAKVQTSRFSDFQKEKLDKTLILITKIQGIKELSGYRLKVVDTADPGNLSFFFEEARVEIKIGNSDFDNRLKILTTVLDQIGSDIDNFRYIDLRFEDPIIGPR
jgi:cell division septal protein FtsQ